VAPRTDHNWTPSTTFNSLLYVTVSTKCKVCGEQIVEAVPKLKQPPRRVQCHRCLCRWWQYERRVRAVTQQCNQPTKETPRDV